MLYFRHWVSNTIVPPLIVFFMQCVCNCTNFFQNIEFVFQRMNKVMRLSNAADAILSKKYFYRIFANFPGFSLSFIYDLEILSKCIDIFSPFATLDIMKIIYLHCSQHPENKTKQNDLLTQKENSSNIYIYINI